MIKKKLKASLFQDGSAMTLSPDQMSETPHKSGWVIRGLVIEDYKYYVRDFEASHPKLGFVRGSFEGEVEASSLKAFNHFYRNHPPENWDYQDL